MAAKQPALTRNKEVTLLSPRRLHVELINQFSLRQAAAVSPGIGRLVTVFGGPGISVL